MTEEEIMRVLKDLIAYYKKCAILKDDVLLNQRGIKAIERHFRFIWCSKE